MARKNRRGSLVIARERNGRLQREQSYAPSEIRRLRDAAMLGLRDPEWGTELGRLYLQGVLTAAMYGAGKRWRDIAAQYRSAIGAFPVRSAALELGRATPADPDSEAGRAQASRETEAKERFFEAHAALVMADIGAEKAVRRLCEEDVALGSLGELQAARRGLQRLSEYYGIDKR